MRKLLRNKKGLTMLEVIVSIAILAVVTVPLVGLFEASLIANKKAEAQIQVNAAMRTIEGQVLTAYLNDSKLIDYTSGTDRNFPAANSEVTDLGFKNPSTGAIDKKFAYDLEDLGDVVGTTKTRVLSIKLKKKISTGFEYIDKFKVYARKK